MAPATQATRLERSLARLAALHPRAIDLSLDRIERLLAALGHPERRLAPVLHCAGTNGKGSTLAFCRAVLERAGYRAHAYTSPHLVRFNERILIDGAEIGDEALLEFLDRAERTNGDAPITFFEITTAAALLAFAETAADIVLLEVGLGGRLDATNVVLPAVSCITPIDFDHQRYLGDTLTAIAGEKAGILKSGVPSVIAAQPPPALAVIEARAAEVKVPLFRENYEWRIERREPGFRFESARWAFDLPPPSLPGGHQLQNAGVAIACLEQLRRFTIKPEAIRRGIASASWPARLQHLSRGPLVQRLGLGWELWLDGAHNPHGARALRQWLEARGRPVDLIAGMIESKDAEKFFAALVGSCRSVTTVPVPGSHAGIDAQELATAAIRVGLRAEPAANVAAAITRVLAQAPEPGIILIAGSLYLAGAVLEENA